MPIPVPRVTDDTPAPGQNPREQPPPNPKPNLGNKVFAGVSVRELWYEQFLHVCRLYRALILLDLTLYLPSASVSVCV